ncbi:MAG TPA: O-antigen ligase family protein [Vicinamibacterales bacterium]|nr:O-antigen ligase family protein [Vicinamibacterales bacterium]
MVGVLNENRELPAGASAGLTRHHGSTAGRLALLGTCVMIAGAPFEAIEPLARWPGQSLSTAEALLGVTIVAWIAAAVWTRTTPEWRTALTWPWLAFVGAMLLAALTAPDHRANALSMVGRLGAAWVAYLMAVNGTAATARLWAVTTAAAASGVLLSAIVVLDYAGFPPLAPLLESFRTEVALVGQYTRASGPFQYPTIASMYLEVVFALGLSLIPRAVGERRWGMLIAATLAHSLIAAAIIATFTRAGLVTLAVSLLVVGSLRWRACGLDRAVQTLALVALVIAMLLVTMAPVESLRLRATTEGISTWFRARIEAPPRVAIGTGATETIRVTVTNTGQSAWDSSVRLSYHWLPAHEDRILSWGGIRTPFPERVSTGQSVTVAARVQAPGEPGEYRLLWDLQQGDRVWFSTEPGAARVVTHAIVSGTAAGPGAPIGSRPLPREAVRRERAELWEAAIRMAAERPLAGVGPDNFRLTYGPYVGLDNFDRRVDSNNMYLEVLVGGGVAGTAAFVWLLAAAGRRLSALVRRSSPTTPAEGIVAATIAIALHGLVDSFLSFTATYVVFAIVLAMLVNAARHHDADMPLPNGAPR